MMATYSDVAEFFKVPVLTIKRWVKQRKIPCIKLSERCVRFDLEEVNKAVRNKYKQEAREF